MNNRELFHNLVILLLVLVMLSGVYLTMTWRGDPENQFLFITSNSLCSSFLIIFGGFLLFCPNVTQDRFVKGSFLRRFMNKKEIEGRIFNNRAHIFGAVMLMTGLLCILALFLK